MKKLLPFVFPAIALVLVLFLAYRWYTTQTVRKDNGQISEFADGVKIDDLTQAQVNKLKQPVKDINTVELKGAEDLAGKVRYELKDGRIFFSVEANLPELADKDGVYQVWLKEVNGDKKRKAFVLTTEKGGYTGSAAISADTLPFEVIVSKETKQDDELETPILRGVIQKDAEKKAE